MLLKIKIDFNNIENIKIDIIHSDNIYKKITEKFPLILKTITIWILIEKVTEY